MTKDFDSEDFDFLLKKNAALEARLERLERKAIPASAPEPDSDLPSGQFKDFSGTVRYESGGVPVIDNEMLAARAERKTMLEKNEVVRLANIEQERASLPRGHRRLGTGQIIDGGGNFVEVGERNEQALHDAFAAQRPEGRG